MAPPAFYPGGANLNSSECRMMVPPAETTLLLIWAGFFAWWWITALRNRTPFKRVPSRFGYLTTMAVPAAVGLAAFALLAPDLFLTRILPATPPLFIGGLAVMLTGLGFAIWARVHLGTNWSGRPAIRENHTITRTGPYAIVRHPIYTGLLAGILGTAIATGALPAFVAFLVMIVLFLIKIRMEEQFLLEEFREKYEQYRHEVAALVPWIV
jgi:protein-S-isoprenylcysteine O-methyltransferase Ste14